MFFNASRDIVLRRVTVTGTKGIKARYVCQLFEILDGLYKLAQFLTERLVSVVPIAIYVPRYFICFAIAFIAVN